MLIQFTVLDEISFEFFKKKKKEKLLKLLHWNIKDNLLQKMGRSFLKRYKRIFVLEKNWFSFKPANDSLLIRWNIKLYIYKFFSYNKMLLYIINEKTYHFRKIGRCVHVNNILTCFTYLPVHWAMFNMQQYNECLL